MITLRDYQQEAIQNVQAAWTEGVHDVLGTAATGTGKTAIFLGLLVDELTRHPDRRALILAHRKELVEQPVQRLSQFWPDWALQVGIVMAERNECNRRVTAATVQTLGSERRLQWLLDNGQIDYLITDECHHAVADIYGQIYTALREANPDMRHLGVTATPIRADGKGMVEVFEEEAFHYDIRWAVLHGWLVPPRWLAIQTGISLKGVSKHDGDYSTKSLANVYETKNCFDLVVASHEQYAAGRQAIAFVETVGGAYRLAEAFRDAGIPAAAADGTTRKSDRSEILRDFRAGRTQVLVNVALWTEGLDIPQVACIHQVRPTQSDGLYIQMIGRALRPVPGKSDALILDYAPVEVRDICMLGDVLGLEVRKDAYVKNSGLEEVGEVVGGFTFDGQGAKWLEGNAAELVSRQLDYLDLSPWAWHRAEDGWMTLALGEGSDKCDRTLAISPADDEGNCVLWAVGRRIVKDKDGKKKNGRSEAYQLGVGDFEALSEQADGIIERWLNPTLMAKNRAWRRQPASSKQVLFARRLKVWQDGMSKGECAEAITHKLTVKFIMRGEHIYVPAGTANGSVRSFVPAPGCAA